MKTILNGLDLLKNEVIIQWNVWKKKFVVACNHFNEEKIPDPRSAKEHYQSFIEKKNTKLVKQSKIITYKPKTLENPNIVDIKSVIIEHPKTSHKLSKTKRETENFPEVGSNISLYSDTKNKWNFLKEKKCKNSKTSTFA